eukprot:TRINITY_DN31157_c0_g1_i1.p1 TRINITY_DN31157_c0_g1~~TRINITY_DN31157_c0_g1_i1.p1  ORF type:complete len:605 (+),score=229.50 TRINITY_DN31157_c0_g1_i1:83-1897(+)
MDEDLVEVSPPTRQVPTTHECTLRVGKWGAEETGQLVLSAARMTWQGTATVLSFDYTRMRLGKEVVRPGQVQVRHPDADGRDERYVFTCDLHAADGLKRLLRVRTERHRTPAPHVHVSYAPVHAQQVLSTSGEWSPAQIEDDHPTTFDESEPQREAFAGSLTAALSRLPLGTDRNGKVELSHFTDPAALCAKAQVSGSFMYPPGSTVQRVYDALMPHTSPFVRDYHAEQKNKDVRVDPWHETPDGTAGWRMFYCKNSTPIGFVDFQDSQRWALTKEGRRTQLTLLGSAQCPKATYGSMFRVETRFDFTQESDSGPVRAQFHGLLRFIEEPNFVVRGLIKSNSVKGLQTSLDVFRKVSSRIVAAELASARAVSQSRRPVSKPPALPPPVAESTPREETHGGSGVRRPSAPASDGPAQPLAGPRAAAAALLLLLVMCMYARYDLASSSAQLEALRAADPDHTLAVAVAALAAWQPSAAAVKRRIQSPLPGKLSAAAVSDLQGRLTHCRALLARYRALADIGGAVRAEDEPQQPEVAEAAADPTHPAAVPEAAESATAAELRALKAAVASFQEQHDADQLQRSKSELLALIATVIAALVSLRHAEIL